jgi:hypothetical protein
VCGLHGRAVGIGVTGAGRGPLDVAEPELRSPSSDHTNCGLNGGTSGGGEALDRTCSMAGRSPGLTEVGQDVSGDAPFFVLSLQEGDDDFFFLAGAGGGLDGLGLGGRCRGGHGRLSGGRRHRGGSGNRSRGGRGRGGDLGGKRERGPWALSWPVPPQVPGWLARRPATMGWPWRRIWARPWRRRCRWARPAPSRLCATTVARCLLACARGEGRGHRYGLHYCLNS